MEYSEKQMEIIDAAEKLFATKGFDGTSVRDIASEAGVNVAMISYYFGSKEKLLEALFTERSMHIRLKLESLVNNETLSPLKKVYVLIDTYIDKVLDKQEFHKIMMREQMSDMNESVRKLIFEMKSKNYELVKQLLQDGQKKGVFRKNIDISMMMTTMIGTVNQTLTNRKFYCIINNMEDVSEEEFISSSKRKLSHHLKALFKATLSYEA